MFRMFQIGSSRRKRRSFFLTFLLLLVLLVVDNECMNGGGEDDDEDEDSWIDNGYYYNVPSSSSSSSVESSSSTQSTVELDGPRKYVALGGNDLIIRYRLSPLSSPSSSTWKTFHQQHSHHSNDSFIGLKATTTVTEVPRTGQTGSNTSSTIQFVMYLTLQEDVGRRRESSVNEWPDRKLSNNHNNNEDVSDGAAVAEDETLISMQILPDAPTAEWKEVQFDCGLIVRGANYDAKLVREILHTDDFSNEPSFIITNKTVIGRLTIKTEYPTIDFDVPYRLESYTASVPISIGLTRSLCKPKFPLPATELTLNLCKHEPDDNDGAATGAKDETNNLIDDDNDESESNSYKRRSNRKTNDVLGYDNCGRIFAILSLNPLEQLEKEGHMTLTVDCSLWGRKGYFRIQIQEMSKNTSLTHNYENRTWIARSPVIRVDWSSIELNFTGNITSIIPCPGNVGLEIYYPSCIASGLDKVRVYGYETLPVPSVLAPKRLNYISEKFIPPNRHHISFSCSLFPQRFSRYCFQYINTAVDGSVAVVVENCLPTFSPEKFADGGWGLWSPWSTCSASCGKEGRKFRYRFCDSPSPSFGAKYCQGNSIEEEPCDTPLPDCVKPKRKSLNTLSIFENDDDDYNDDDEHEGGGESEGNEVGFYSSSRIEEDEGGKRNNRKGRISSNASSFMHINNLNHTFGCECGCLLHNLVPGFNYSLIVTLPPSQSYCDDEDEEEHHNLKWILHAKGDGNRIRFLIVGADLQCMTLSFRDGNTTDSNLLEVITMSTQYSLFEPPSTATATTTTTGHVASNFKDTEDPEEEGEPRQEVQEQQNPLLSQPPKKKEESRRLRRLLHIIESTGASLSIATSESSRNCSAPTVYFVAYYHIVPGNSHAVPTGMHSAVTADAHRNPKLEWHAYEFWTFLLIKLVLTFFVIIILFTTFGGFATKVYRRTKYKQLKWICHDPESQKNVYASTANGELEDSEEETSAEEGDDDEHRLMNGESHNCSSRSTSVTLMSFDHNYWKQIRTLRLKHFLLQPRKQKQLTKVKSFPSTPVHGKPIKLAFRISKSGNDESRTCETEEERALGSICSKSNAETHGNNIEENDVTVLKMPDADGGGLVAYDWRKKKELNKLTSLSDTNLKNMKRVNLKEIANNDDDTSKVIQCYKARKTKDGSRPPSIIIVRSKSSNVPMTLQTQSSFPLTAKNYIKTKICTCSEEQKTGEKYHYGTCFNCTSKHRLHYDKNTIKVEKEDDERMECRKEEKTWKDIEEATVSNEQVRKDNEKIRKEKENLKRREIESQIFGMKECRTRFETDEDSGLEERKQRKRDYDNKKMDNRRAESTATRSSTPASTTSSLIVRQKQQKSTLGDSDSSSVHSLLNNSSRRITHLYNKYGDSRDTDFLHDDDEEEDFEMDYYDYDASNAANIPGSLFGLEPAFVLWNSETYYQDEDVDIQVNNDTDNLTVSQTEDLFPRTVSSTTNTFNDNDDIDIATISDNGEMMELIMSTTDSNMSSSSTAPPPSNSGTSVKPHRKKNGDGDKPNLELELQEQKKSGCTNYTSAGRTKSQQMLQVKETSLDTLKFVDETELFDDEL